MRHWIRPCLPLLTICLLGGCSGGRPRPAGGPGGASAAEAPPDAAKRQAVQEEAAIASALQEIAKTKSKTDYKLNPADLINVTIYPDAELGRRTRVSQNGTISLPLVGAVQVAGLSVLEAEEAVAAKLRHYLVSPQVSIFIEEYSNKQVYVLGEVARPGSFPIPTESRLTVLQAVSAAGGFTPVAAPDHTKILRYVEGKSQTIEVEVSAITQKGEKDKDLPLQPNDIVYVPQSFF